MKLLLSLAALALAGCVAAPVARQPALIRPTASGFAEGTFRNTTIAAVQSKFADRCAQRGGEVQDLNAMQITCVIMITGNAVDVIAVQQGGLYLQPRVRTQWTLIQQASDVRVTAGSWRETDGIGGPTKVRLTDNYVRNKMQSTLFAMGAE